MRHYIRRTSRCRHCMPDCCDRIHQSAVYIRASVSTAERRTLGDGRFIHSLLSMPAMPARPPSVDRSGLSKWRKHDIESIHIHWEKYRCRRRRRRRRRRHFSVASWPTPSTSTIEPATNCFSASYSRTRVTTTKT